MHIAKTPQFSLKQICFCMIPVWLLWTYVAYLLITSNIQNDRRRYIKFDQSFLNQSISAMTLQQNFIHKIEAQLNRANIARIYRYLGGVIEDEQKIAFIPKKDLNKLSTVVQKFKQKPERICGEIPKLEGRVRPDLSPHNLSLIVPPPLPCISRHKVALIIPYRDREEHLMTLLNTLHPLLYRQQIQYRVYVVEQFGNDTFNKGVLMNAGVRESLRDLDFMCFVFHDVDLIPEDDRNMYTCPYMPRHMSVAVDKFNYTLPYSLLVGGVFSIRLDHFLAVNGYSNLYWGWGGEDDDMAYRIKYRKLEITRPPETIARYSMIKHEHRPESPNAIRTALLRMAKKRSSRDGLNTVKYRVVWRRDLPSHTHLMIDIGRNHRWHFMDSQQRLVINF